MSYIGFNKSSNRFFVTDKVDEGVFMGGKLLMYEHEAEALDMVDSLNGSQGKDPPMGIEIHYCSKHAHYNVDIKGQHTCTCV